MVLGGGGGEGEPVRSMTRAGGPLGDMRGGAGCCGGAANWRGGTKTDCWGANGGLYAVGLRFEGA
jgi:hypothetical protein